MPRKRQTDIASPDAPQDQPQEAGTETGTGTEPPTATTRTQSPGNGGTIGGNRPVHAVRLGRIRASIWANPNEHGTFYSVKVSRNYRDGEGWKSTDSFGRDDLLVAAKVLDLAHTWICETLAATSGTGEAPL
jgi:hypothetical protein